MVVLSTGAQRVDVILAVLADPHRRLSLALLRQASEPVEESQLAAALDRIRDRSATERLSESSGTALYHAHLPALENEGLVEWDREQSTVAYSPEPLVDDLLDELADYDRFDCDADWLPDAFDSR